MSIVSKKIVPKELYKKIYKKNYKKIVSKKIVPTEENVQMGQSFVLRKHLSVNVTDDDTTGQIEWFQGR